MRKHWYLLVTVRVVKDTDKLPDGGGSVPSVGFSRYLRSMTLMSRALSSRGDNKRFLSSPSWKEVWGKLKTNPLLLRHDVTQPALSLECLLKLTSLP